MRKICFILAIFWAAHLPAHAAYKMGGNRPVQKSKDVRSTSTVIDETPYLKDLSRIYSVDMERLRYYRSQKNGYEELVPALVVAREGQVDLGRVLSARMEGRTWKEIAARHSVDLKPLNDEVLSVLTPIRKGLPKKMLVERPRKMK
jgi:hypothetical protein